MPIEVSVTDQNVQVSTSGQTVNASVSGGVGPAGTTGATGPQGPAGAAGTTTWAGITDRPATYTPSTHTHAAGDIASGTIDVARLPSVVVRVAPGAVVNGITTDSCVISASTSIYGNLYVEQEVQVDYITSQGGFFCNDGAYSGSVATASYASTGIAPNVMQFLRDGQEFCSIKADGNISTDGTITAAGLSAPHQHGNITSAGAIGSTSGQIVVTTTGGVLATAATISSGQVSGLAASATTDTTNATNITSGTLPAARLPATAVTAASYGSASSVATFTVDSAGRLTAAGSTAISVAASAIASGTLAEARLPNLVILHPFLLAGM